MGKTLRILDCKIEGCKEELKDAPYILEHLCDECSIHFETVKQYLGTIGLEYSIDPKIVRGLDYYTKTAFEIISNEIGAQGTVCGGGRYDGLVEEIGGPPTPGIGFGMGMERLLLTLDQHNITIPRPNGLDLFIATLGSDADKMAFQLIYQLRRQGIKVDKDVLGRSLKAQLKYANRIQARNVLILGQEELDEGWAIIKHMETGEQKEIHLNNTVDTLLHVIQG